jgi:hypothetical protein
LFAAYYVPGRVTTGFRTWIHHQQWSEDLRELKLTLSVQPTPGGNPPLCLVGMPESAKVQVKRNGQILEKLKWDGGSLEIPLLPELGRQRLEISC